MFNRVTNIFTDTVADEAPRGWRVDERPAFRLTCLYLLLVTPLLIVAGRLFSLQSHLIPEIVQRFEATSETSEPIPSRDGRILSSDGRVLSADVQRFEIRVHYRWLEEPADEVWLRRRALSQLSRSQRRDPELVQQAIDDVLQQRETLWRQLAEVTGQSPKQLAAGRQAVQKRIERIVANVEQRRRQPVRSPEPLEELPSGNDSDSGFRSLWKRASHTVRSALTTSPRRSQAEPLIIREELDYHTVIADVPLEVAAGIESRPKSFPGVQVQTITRRVYPAGSFAAHIIGLRREISDEELERRQVKYADTDPLDYDRGDRIGQSGVERAYDRYLRGLRGKRKIVRDLRGEIIETEVLSEPRVGRDIVLTLDAPLQAQAEAILDRLISELPDNAEDGTAAAGGCIVAMDAWSGELLAAASAPRFDLETAASPTPEQWRDILNDPRRPLYHRMAEMAVAPGSTFKALTSVALLESGLWDPDEKRHCQGFLDQPNRYRCYVYRHYGVGHGDLDLTDAIARSCNVYFFSGARLLGPEPLVIWADRFGFGQPTGIDLPGERGGNLPRPPKMRLAALRGSPDQLTDSDGDSSEPPWYSGDTLGMAIGQAQLTTTPLQVARLMAAIANGGYLVTPHVVRQIRDGGASGGERSIFPEHPTQHIPGLREGTLSRIREGLEKVVSHPRGTGYKRVRLEEVAIAGKTGTAEVGPGRGDHAWFAGYVPADRPRIAFAIILEHAGSGGQAAGPVARELVQAMLKTGVITPNAPTAAISTPATP